MTQEQAGQSQRIDQWLWFSRIFKTRTLAGKVASAGKIRVNSQRISKASHAVHVGDSLTFILNDQLRVIAITGIGKRRGPASEAQSLYEDRSPPAAKPENTGATGNPVAARAPGAGRPTKKERRELDRLKT